MAIIPGFRENSQFGLEATEGAGATVTKQFTSFGLSATDDTSVWSVRPRGQTTVTAGGTSWKGSGFSVEDGFLSYNEPVYWLESVVKKVTATTPSGGTNSRQRVYSADQFAADTFQSYKVEVGNKGTPNRGVSAIGVSASEWGFSVAVGDDEVGMSGAMLGGALTDPATMTTGGGVVVSNAIPVHPTQVVLSYAMSGAGLSAGTVISNAFEASFNITDRRSLYYFLGNATGTAAGTVESDGQGFEFDLTLADEAAPLDTFLTSLRAGTKVFFRVKFTGPIIEGAIPFSLQLDICTLLRDSPNRTDTQNVLSRELPLQAAYDSTWGKAFELTSVTDIVTL